MNVGVEQLGVAENCLQRGAELVTQESEKIRLDQIRHLRVFTGFALSRQQFVLYPVRRGELCSSQSEAKLQIAIQLLQLLVFQAQSFLGEAIARVVQKVLDFTTKNPSADFDQVREIAETEGTRVASSLNHRVIYLADIGTIAPMLGLLGTVFGIITSFSALGSDLGTHRYAMLSSGVSTALVNTAAGLAVGIPGMIFYAYFRGKVQRIISDLEAAVTHILALLSLQYNKRMPERTPVLLEDEF